MVARAATTTQDQGNSRMDDPTTSHAGLSASPCLSILVPVFNERGTIRQVIEKIRRTPFPATTEIIIVDDGSTDGSADVLRRLPDWSNVRVCFHDRNRGKGSAVQTALCHAAGKYVVVQDADLELDPKDIIPLLETVQQGRADVCYGSRFMRDTRQFHGMPTYWANRGLNLTCNLLNGIHLTDMNTCYKMMRTDVARRINLVSRGFAMEPEITTKLARMKVHIAEHPIEYRPRSTNDGKKIRPSDFFRYLTAMVRFRFLS